jgi:glycine/D-amino acid oxidase-like deaminating enzyme
MSDATHIVVVVGAGIVGAAVAEALALDGHRVTVVDRGPPGAGATAAGMGHVVVMDDSPAQIALTSYSQRLWDERGPTLPPAGERVVCGTLWVAADDEEMAEVARKADFSCGRGWPVGCSCPATAWSTRRRSPRPCWRSFACTAGPFASASGSPRWRATRFAWTMARGSAATTP